MHNKEVLFLEKLKYICQEVFSNSFFLYVIIILTTHKHYVHVYMYLEYTECIVCNSYMSLFGMHEMHS